MPTISRETVPRPGRAYTEAIAISQASGNIVHHHIGYNRPGSAYRNQKTSFIWRLETYRRVLQLVGDQPLPIAGEAYLGLARIFYEWNDLDAAEQHGQQSLQLARQYDNVIDRFVICEVFLARLKLARGDVAGAAAMLAETEQSVRQHNFVQRMPEVAAAQVLVLLRQGDLAAAAQSGQDARTPPQPGPGTPGPGRPVRSAGGAGAIAPADGSKGLGRMNGSR